MLRNNPPNETRDIFILVFSIFRSIISGIAWVRKFPKNIPVLFQVVIAITNVRIQWNGRKDTWNFVGGDETWTGGGRNGGGWSNHPDKDDQESLVYASQLALHLRPPAHTPGNVSSRKIHRP